MERITAQMVNPVQAHKLMTHAWGECIKPMLVAGHRLVLEVRPERRSDAQNRRLWAMLADVSERVEWYGQWLTAEDWKHVFTAALQSERVVPGLNGGFVVLGQRTSKMTKSEMIALHDLIEAFGAEKGVKFKAVTDG
ncbi:ninb protein [Caudoviricetes sp.]|nr:ninb protein [Caudoviricetes sp.]